MKAKIFEAVLHKFPSGKTHVSAAEGQLNQFLGQHPNLRLPGTHMSTLVSPARSDLQPDTTHIQ